MNENEGGQAKPGQQASNKHPYHAQHAESQHSKHRVR